MKINPVFDKAQKDNIYISITHAWTVIFGKKNKLSLNKYDQMPREGDFFLVEMMMFFFS
jgi:hypothetical protein